MSIKVKHSRLRSIINIFLFVLFALFAVIQLNDPDPIHWFLIYSAVGVLSLAANYVLIPKAVMWVLIIGLLIYATTLIGYFIDWLKIDDKEEIFGEMVYERPYLEGTREFLGVILAVLALLFQFKKKPN